MRDREPLPLRVALARLLKRALHRFRSTPQLTIPEKPPKPPNTTLDWIWNGKYWVTPWFPRTSDHLPVKIDIVQRNVATITLFCGRNEEQQWAGSGEYPDKASSGGGTEAPPD